MDFVNFFAVCHSDRPSLFNWVKAFLSLPGIPGQRDRCAAQFPAIRARQKIRDSNQIFDVNKPYIQWCLPPLICKETSCVCITWFNLRNTCMNRVGLHKFRNHFTCPRDHKHLATKSFGSKLFANNIYWVKIFALQLCLPPPKKKKKLKYL